MSESHFNKVAVLTACNFIKKDSDSGDFLKICEIVKNNYFEEHLCTTASKPYIKETPVLL